MLTLVTPPSIEPVTLAEAKLHLRVEIDDDDGLISALISAAREMCEGWTSRSFLTTSWRLTLDYFPWHYRPGVGRSIEREMIGAYASYGLLSQIKLPRADLIAVSSLSYVDVAGDTQVLDPSGYQVEPGAPGRIVPAYGTSWPSTRIQPGAVTVDFSAGYGATVDKVPAIARSAIKLMIGHLYENREATVSAAIGLREAPLAVRTLLALLDWGGDYA